MKLKLVFILMWFTYSTKGQAQENFQSITTVGIKGGVNFSRILFDPTINENIVSGYTGGLILKHFAQPNIGVQLELNYSQRGWGEKIDSLTSYSRKLNYIELPFMTHIYAGKGKTKFITNFGPNISYLMSYKDDVNGENKIAGYQQKNVDNKFDFGLCFGIGVLRKTSIGDFQLEGRILQSLSNIISNKQGIDDSRSQVFGFSLSYLMERFQK